MSPTDDPPPVDFEKGPKIVKIPSMPAFANNRTLIPLHSFIGSIWRLFYWLSFALVLIIDLWAVRYKDWGILKIFYLEKK